MAMPRATSGPAYPERFYAAASYVGLDGSDSSAKNVISKFPDDTALLLYALYQQATVGPCNTPKPSAWRPVEQSKWKRLDWVLCFAHTYLRLTFMHLSLVLLFLFLRL
jgi:hypothetical protein